MSNLGRVLTIRVKITDPEQAKWIWDAHVGAPAHGVAVEAIANGNLFEPPEDVIQIEKRYYIREEGEDTEAAVEAHCNGGFLDLAEAIQDAPRNVSFGAKWDIVDINGKVYASGTAKSE